ncbi:hypothetical protein NDU88_001034 [Pleurodeles waltl]|uniref:Uncharacterized protein n=1 Tax=Pleurodeles waltl TaxID=8319 RepID=A0AAV7URN6_PLEWA|nr:hypothetical protein NDU88_001034 [Pleurodeles waltl]
MHYCSGFYIRTHASRFEVGHLNVRHSENRRGTSCREALPGQLVNGKRTTRTMCRNKAARTPSHSADSRAYPERSNSSATRDCVPPTNPAPPDKLNLILQEIRESWTAIDHLINSIASDLSILRDDHKKMADKVNAAEGTLSKLIPPACPELGQPGRLQASYPATT